MSKIDTLGSHYHNRILKLGKLIPNMNDPGNVPSKASHSKGGILARACEYVQEMRREVAHLEEKVRL
jgi:hypothetical protein